MTRTRLPPAERREHLVRTALLLALDSHYTKVSIRAIAAHAEVSHPLVIHYFGTQHQLQTEMLKLARKLNINRVLAQAIVAQDPRVRRMPKAEKKRILDSVT